MAGPGESPGLLQSLRSRLIDVYKIPVAFSLGFTAVTLVVVRVLDLLNGAAAEVSGFAERGLL